MRISNNIMALNTHRQYTINNENVAKSTEKLSSGYRVNRAGDDAAGLAISEKMRAQIRGLNMASKNSQDAISLVQTAEGALTETHAILQRMRELATQSASDTNTTIDRQALDAEFQQLKTEISDIASTTKFNDMNLLDGTFGVQIDTDPLASTLFAVTGFVSVTARGAANETYTFADDGANLTVTRGSDNMVITLTGGTMAGGAQTLAIEEFGIYIELDGAFLAEGLDGAVIEFGSSTGGQIQTGANELDNLNISIAAMNTAVLNIDTTSVSTRTNAESAITAVNSAINQVSTQRANLGAIQNRLQHKINNLDTSAENLQAAESRIRDLDMAKEMTAFTKNNILSQAATAMLAQANAAPQGVLQLLK